ncbi:DNA-processing protein DprA [Streptacidiphilus sp. P02-A3a]|uniref:DNA-processing protein DprA n=1 Tax=Streptacidiphilus sp. P02-A3a TaxID=2704468 RepID=UPI001CDB5126|nr:DNA-processing protein DprA [Streptacidiphilus sp. P02-A3a]QMU72321.1 DNA-protecting protein DprA [Streptacidiphilus sp. P02-A3a]
MPTQQLSDAERVARAALSRIVEPGDEDVGALLERHGPQEVLARLLAGPAGEGFRARALGADPVADLAHAHALGARLVCPGEAEWPTQLDDLGPARPIGLWVRGPASLRLLALRSVAVVGARACTAYGVHVAADLAAELADAAWVVVSGGAYGIDAAAHRGALAATGVTIGVLACGVDQCYPRGHSALLGRIAEQGLLISELPLGAHPTRSRFLLRNRVIAALTRGTVVVEAARRSGALSTARRARDLRRLVMGVPGPVTSELSCGVHALLRSGGSLVTDAAEVIELVGAIGADLAEARPGPVLPRDALGGEALRVLDAVPLGRLGAPVDRLVRGCGLPSDTVLRRLYELGALGLVERRGGSWCLR